LEKINIDKFFALSSTAKYYLLLLIAILLPIARTIIPLLLVLLFISCLFEVHFKEKWEIIKKTKLLFILPSFYILHIIGLCYTSNLNNGLFDLEVKLSLFFIPLTFININENNKINYTKILLFFIIGNLLEAFLCIENSIVNVFYKYSSDIIVCLRKDPRSFFNDNFTYYFLSKSFHPSYFSMYCAMCTQIIIYFFINNIYKKHRTLLISIFIFFVFFIFLLSSKAGIIAIVILILCDILIFLKRKKNFWIGSLSILCLSVLFFITLNYNQRLTILFNQLKATSINSKSIKTNEDRLLIWFNSKSIIENYPIFGVGTGDVKDKLLEVYNENDMQKAISQRYNAHNQFLETLISLGIIGLSILLAVLIIPIIIAFKKRDILLFVFILIIFINFIFESMLNTQAGVVFFAFFYSFLCFANNNKILINRRNLLY